MCATSQLRSRGGTRVEVDGRAVAIFQLGTTLYALDHFCYHAGGPLSEASIEELGGRVCVRCPWHSYRIALTGEQPGEGLYLSIDPFNKDQPPVVKSKGVKQRPHEVKAENGRVFVRLSSSPRSVASDEYAEKNASA